MAKNYVEKLLSSLNATQLSALSSCFNSTTPTYTIRLKTLSPFYKGINYVIFKEGFFNKRLGILVYTDTQCSFFEFDSCNVEVYDIDVETKETRKANVCVLSKADFKALVFQYLDIAGGEESDWEKIMKNRIKIDPQDNDILLINDGMQVDNNGDCTIGRDLYVEDEIVIDGLQKLVDTNGYPFIPDPSGHLNEALVHYTSGYAWKKGYELKGFQVVAKSVFEGSFVYQTHTIYFVWNDTQGADYGSGYFKYYEE